MITAAKVQGLTRAEITQRQEHFGMNQIAEERPRFLLMFLGKFWGPIPWMLEATMLLQLALGKVVDATIIVLMLIVNAIISYTYERKARSSLAMLQQKLTIQTRALRDGKWVQIPAQELVPDDIVRLRAGDVIPADIAIVQGNIAVDQSMLTGESDLIELATGSTAYAASVIRRGESIGQVTATGMSTSYSKTAKLIQIAKPGDHGDAFVQRIVMYLMGFTAILAILVLLYSLLVHLPFIDTLLFVLALLIAAIPVSLPVTFTLATAVGSSELAQHGVLATRLPAIKEAAGMDILCSDKTGTITKNELTVVGLRTYHDYSKKELLRYAALASDEATHDPIDLAILTAAHQADVRFGKAKRVEFTPFDPANKRTEALIRKHKKRIRVIKGSPTTVSQLTNDKVNFRRDVERLSASGNRCIAIAEGKEDKTLKAVGLIVLRDLPREDAPTVVERLHQLGVRVLMITGDGLATAVAVARQVGISGPACTADKLHEDMQSAAETHEVFARVYPEDKYRLVQALQSAGHIVGMTGDGINDAPAIRQAEIGIAVNNATDITKSAASLVLTAPGLHDLLAAIEIGRAIFQRISTYTLNKIIKTFHVGLFLTLGLILTGTLLAEPIHILLVVLANDLVSMSLTTDRVTPSSEPDHWQTLPLLISGLILAISWVIFSFGMYLVGRDGLRLDADQLYALVFLMLVGIAQANVYLIREERHFWKSRPSRWLLVATAVDVVIVTLLATNGILMASLPLAVVLSIFVATTGFMVVLDPIKVWMFRQLELRFGVAA